MTTMTQLHGTVTHVAAPPPRLTAIFDGNCVICQGSRGLVRALDWGRRVAFVDLHDPATLSRLFPEIPYEQAMGQVHVVTPEGTVLGGFAGTRRMMRALPLGWPFWALLHLPGMTWVGERVYRFIARNRYRVNTMFGRDCSDGLCRLPD